VVAHALSRTWTSARLLHSFVAVPPSTPRQPPRRELEVEIVAAVPATGETLARYLTDAGVGAVRAADIGGLRADIDAVVWFPDELDAALAIDGLLRLRRARPKLLIIIVTSAPQRYRPAFEPDANARLPVVLARPAFGWAILDAIRGHADLDRS
jgi:hypothetical protein